MCRAGGERVTAAADERYGVVLNVQQGTTMRFECHVDSNPLTGLLFFTDHSSGGELVIAHDPAASDIQAVERDCSVIRPHAGHLIFFDARRHPHYARPLVSEACTRVVAVMNFYTESFPESTRPAELLGLPGGSLRAALDVIAGLPVVRSVVQDEWHVFIFDPETGRLLYSDARGQR